MINYEHVFTSAQVLILRYARICKHEIVIPKMANNFCKRQEYFLFVRGSAKFAKSLDPYNKRNRKPT